MYSDPGIHFQAAPQQPAHVRGAESASSLFLTPSPGSSACSGQVGSRKFWSGCEQAGDTCPAPATAAHVHPPLRLPRTSGCVLEGAKQCSWKKQGAAEHWWGEAAGHCSAVPVPGQQSVCVCVNSCDVQWTPSTVKETQTNSVYTTAESLAEPTPKMQRAVCRC